MSDPLQRKLRLLEYLAGSSGSSVPGLPDWAGPAGSRERASAISDLEEFDARGWLRNFTVDFEGGACAQLVGPGYAFVDEVRARRQDRQLRHDAVLDALLAWLYDRYLDDVQAPAISGFLTTRFGQFYGEPFSESEIARGTKQLAEDGYLTGAAAWGAGVVRPSITSEGIRAARSRRSVNDDRPIPMATIVSISGDHNTVQAGSAGATQHVATTITDDHRTQALQLAATVEQAATLLGAAAAADAAEVRRAAGQDEPGVLRAALHRLQVTLLSGSADLLGEAILGGAAGLLAHYGVPT